MITRHRLLAACLGIGSAMGALGCGAASPQPAAPGRATPRLLGYGPRVAMAELELRGDEVFHVPVRGCQDVLALVVDGTAAVAPQGDQEALLTPGRGIRIGHGATNDPTIRAQGDGARLFLVLSRPDRRPFPDQTTVLELLSPPSCREPDDDSFALADGSRAGPFLHRDGKLRVTIHLDAGHGAVWAGLGMLDADADVDVPEHVHEASAEVLYFLEGEGTMRLGDRRIAIHPGSFVYVPQGTPHGFVPSGSRPLRAYQSYAPSGPEQRFRIVPAGSP